jgi:hypothetical protein
MFTAQQALGCLVLDIDGPVLEARFLRHDGEIGDHFTILKGVRAVPPRISAIRVRSEQIELTWNSIPWRYYRVYRSSGLGKDWEPASPWLWAGDRTMSWSELTVPPGSANFYQIQISVD